MNAPRTPAHAAGRLSGSARPAVKLPFPEAGVSSIDLGDDTRTIRRTTAQAVRDIKAFGPRGGKTGTQEAAR